jgi:hypothetical protein
LFDCPLNATLGITTIKITACYALLSKRYVLAFRLQCRFWVLELNVLIRERSGLFTFPCTTLSCSRSKSRSCKRTLHFHTTQTTTVQQTNEYFVFKELTMLK